MAGALPPWVGLSLGLLVGLASAPAVSAAVRALTQQPQSGRGAIALKTALALGARAHALRAFRAGDKGGGSAAAMKAALTMNPAELAAAALARSSSSVTSASSSAATAVASKKGATATTTTAAGEEEVEGLRRCRVQLRAMADADWLAARLPGLGRVVCRFA